MTRLGWSLKVPCVQELAKEKTLTTIPQRYVKNTDQNNTYLFHYDQIKDQLPVIDLQNLMFGADVAMMNLELEKLHHACKYWGFFQLINHGVDSSLVETMKLEIQKLFNLPLEEKQKLWQEPSDIEGFGQAFVVSEEQKLDWGDMFYIVTLPTHVRKPRLYSHISLVFRETSEAYSAELKILAMKILGLMAKALKIQEEEILKLFENGMQSMRMNYYPPCPQPELANGLSPHSDGTGLTILLQVNDVEALQVKKDGMWIPVKPLDNAFIVNIGDMLEIITNGVYPSIEHRATLNKEKERLSIATFLSPEIDVDLAPAPSLITPQTPALFRKSTVADFLKGFLSQELREKSYLDFMRIQSEECENK